MSSSNADRNWLTQIGIDTSARRSDQPLRRDRRELFARVVFFAFVSLVLAAPLMTLGDSAESGQGSLERQVGYLLLWGCSLIIVWSPSRPLDIFKFPIPLLVALGWCAISITWAINPETSFRRFILTIVVMWTVFLQVQKFGYRDSVDMLRIALVVATIINYIVVFVNPTVGTHYLPDSSLYTADHGQWRGFMAHKNFAGAACAITILLFLFDAKHIKPALRIGAIVLAGVFLFKSESKTSAGMLGLAAASGYTFQWLGRNLRIYLVPLMAFGGSLLWFFLMTFKDALKANYLDPAAFTGRGQIWTALINYASDHLWLGSGFGSFWNIGGSSPIYAYGRGFVTEVTEGHDGYLDLLITVGLPGMLLAVFAMIVWPLFRLVLIQGLVTRQAALLITMLVFCMGHNVTESSIFERDMTVGLILTFILALSEYLISKAPVSKGKAAKSAGDDVMQQLRNRQA